MALPTLPTKLPNLARAFGGGVAGDWVVRGVVKRVVRRVVRRVVVLRVVGAGVVVVVVVVVVGVVVVVVVVVVVLRVSRCCHAKEFFLKKSSFCALT